MGSEVLLRDHERFNDPRDLHIEDGVIYCLANIEHDAVTFSRGTARQGRAQDDTHLVEYRL